jgi:glutamate racemase
MKIGIFDSGLGGLLIAKAIKKMLPEHDFVYLGDTKRVPYGNRSHETVYEFTREAVEYLFEKENCALVILACNTASARALRRIQQEFLPKEFPNRKVLGVLIPAAEEAANYKKVGVIATVGTVNSGTFVDEIKKVNPKIKVFQNPAPMLVPLIEAGERELANPFIKKYVAPLVAKKIDALILGCTHYPILKNQIKKEIKNLLHESEKGGGVPSALGKEIKVISQDEIIPKKLKDYLKRHKEIDEKLSRKGSIKILFTDIAPTVEELTRKWFGKNVKAKHVEI